MKKLLIVAILLLVFICPLNAQSTNDLNYRSYNGLGQLHNKWMAGPAVVISFDYGGVKLIREEYYTNGKLDRIGAPAVVYSSVRYTFGNKSLPIYWRGAKTYYQEWWLNGKRYTKTEYNKQLYK